MHRETKPVFASFWRGVSFLALAVSLTLGLSAPATAGAICGPGAHWVDTCAGGTYNLASTSTFGVLLDLDLNGSLETSIPFIQFHGTTNVFLGTPAGHTIPTEMYSLLEFGPSGSILRAGDLVPNTLNDGPLHSPGSIVEQGGNPFLADSFFDVFFEIDLGGGYVLHNNTPLQVQSVIDRAPPIVFTIYQTLNLPLDLFDVANVKRGELHPAAGVGGPFPHHIITPEPSALGLMGLGLGAVVLLRRRFSR